MIGHVSGLPQYIDKLFKLTLVDFLIGNEDMHVKNFSLMTIKGKVELTPAYDLLNTTIALSNPQEEIALPIRGKKRKIGADLLIDYFGRNRLGMTQKTVSSVMNQIAHALPAWEKLIDVSFLSDLNKTKYRQLLNSRRKMLFVWNVSEWFLFSHSAIIAL